MRATGLAKAARAGGNEVAKDARKRAPRGNPSHKPEKKPLHKTIGTVIREYANGVVMAVVGPKYPEGAHGHLVEEGHEIVTKGPEKRRTGLFAKIKKFLAPAGDTTQVQQRNAVYNSLRKTIKEAGG